MFGKENDMLKPMSNDRRETMEKRDVDLKISDVLLKIPFPIFAVITVSLPAVGLAFCFISAMIFRFEDVNFVMCGVKNYIPSISAVIGITPQAYIWKICIALHSTPRFAVTLLHYNYYMYRVHLISNKYQLLFKKLVILNSVLNFVENASLVTVSYITNKENYPLHEKIFVCFMVTSLCYMLLNTILYKWSMSPVMSAREKQSYKEKKGAFVAISSATIGLIIFFIKHRVFCHAMAFSYFSAFEYIIAYANMAYHMSARHEFNHNYWYLGSPTEKDVSNGTVKASNKHQ